LILLAILPVLKLLILYDIGAKPTVVAKPAIFGGLQGEFPYNFSHHFPSQPPEVAMPPVEVGW